MEKYQEYKPSNVQWIGDIPMHWENKQLRSFLCLFTEKGHGDAQLLSVTREQGVIERDKDDKEENHNFVPEDLSGYKYIEKGDFAINKMKAWQGSYAVSEFNGIVSPAYYTCKLRGVEKEFFSIAIRSKAYVPFFTQYSKGIRVGQWDLNPNALKTIPFFLPPLAEQKKIVSYLEGKTSKIDAYVAEKEKEILLLQELKQKTIADAVTKGLNPDVKMKDSGISWIGMIPEHWETKRIASLFLGKVDANADFKYHHAFKFYYGTLVPKNEIGDIEEYKDTYVKYSVLKKDDIIINGLNLNYDFVSQRVAIAPSDGIITSAYVVVRPRKATNAQYYNNLFKTMDNMKLFHGMGTGIRLTLSFDELKKQIVVVPPKDEQCAIVAYIDEKCKKIDTLVSELQAEIDNMKEYKQRLIADCVTGQVNVQNETV